VLAWCAASWLGCSSEPVCPEGDCKASAVGGESAAGSPSEPSEPSEPSAGAPETSEGGAPTTGGAPSAAGQATTGGENTGESAGAGGICDDAPLVVGTVVSDELSELSGIVASVEQPGVYYVHNDSGDSARLFAIDEQGRTLAEIVLVGATAVDWEDIALGPGPGGESFIYVGDIGDNAARVGGEPRASIDVYRVAEPLILSDESVQRLELTAWERLPLVYPDAPHDSEALLLDPERAELLLVTKENDGKSLVFQASALAAADGQQTLGLLTQIQFSTTDTPGSTLVTSGEMSPQGDAILLRTYTSVFYWPRTGSTISDAFAHSPRVLTAPDEQQGEAITFSADGGSYVTVSESEHAAVYRATICDL
jgi:hypothetical protein